MMEMFLDDAKCLIEGSLFQFMHVHWQSLYLKKDISEMNINGL